MSLIRLVQGHVVTFFKRKNNLTVLRVRLNVSEIVFLTKTQIKEVSGHVTLTLVTLQTTRNNFDDVIVFSGIQWGICRMVKSVKVDKLASAKIIISN